MIDLEDAYNCMTEGERCHMFNKLAKHGYDRRNGHTVAMSLSPKQLKEAQAYNEPTYKLGHRVTTIGSEYILALKGGNVVGVLNINEGLWWSHMAVANVKSITQSEFNTLTEGL